MVVRVHESRQLQSVQVVFHCVPELLDVVLGEGEWRGRGGDHQRCEPDEQDEPCGGTRQKRVAQAWVMQTHSRCEVWERKYHT